MKAADLRGILGYIARFRDKLFVLNIDSEVMAQARQVLGIGPAWPPVVPPSGPQQDPGSDTGPDEKS